MAGKREIQFSRTGNKLYLASNAHATDTVTFAHRLPVTTGHLASDATASPTQFNDQSNNGTRQYDYVPAWCKQVLVAGCKPGVPGRTYPQPQGETRGFSQAA